MIKEPTGQLPQSPFNPYAAPRAEAAAVPVVDQPFRVHTVLVLCGGFLGLLITGVHLFATRSVPSLAPMTALIAMLEVCQGVLAGMGVGIFVDSLLQRKFSRLAPGHWFLLLIVARLAGQFGAEIWNNSEDFQIGTGSFSAWYYAETLIYNGLAIVMLLPIVLTTTEPLRWKAYAWAMLFFSLVAILQFPMASYNETMVLGTTATFFTVTASLGAMVLAVALFALVIVEFVVDRPRASSRDLYHWLGVFSPAVLTILAIVISMAITYSQSFGTDWM
ncbi:hypothetical protein [Bremerella alba]|nr:hypothetical protein [Bremerella alba]